MRAQFVARNLFEMTADGPGKPTARPSAGWSIRRERVRSHLVKAVAEHRQCCDSGHGPRLSTSPERIVYVSCNPATLARDAGLLVHQAGYRCSAAGVVNMFPHTAHVGEHGGFRAAMKKGRPGRPLRQLCAYSRSPPKMPSRDSRLWKMLNTSR
jgi:23S rRNA (uracil1939-C5)-methyltransferase